MEPTSAIYFANLGDEDRARATAWLVGTEGFAFLRAEGNQSVLLRDAVIQPAAAEGRSDTELAEALRIIRGGAACSDEAARRAEAFYDRAVHGDFAAACEDKIDAALATDSRCVLVLRGRVRLLEEAGEPVPVALRAQLSWYEREAAAPLSVDDVARLVVVQNFACAYCMRVMRFAHFAPWDPSQFTVGRVLDYHLHVFSNTVVVCLGCRGKRAAAGAAMRRMMGSSFDEAMQFTACGVFDANPMLVLAGVEDELRDCVARVDRHVADRENVVEN